MAWAGFLPPPHPRLVLSHGRFQLSLFSLKEFSGWLLKACCSHSDKVKELVLYSVILPPPPAC